MPVTRCVTRWGSRVGFEQRGDAHARARLATPLGEAYRLALAHLTGLPERPVGVRHRSGRDAAGARRSDPEETETAPQT